FYAHIGGMDAFARGLLAAHEIMEDGVLADFTARRYAGYDSGMGRKIMEGKADFADMEDFIHQAGEPTPVSGRQEYLENLINTYL
ncbi:MAG: xylose isomerase, partial [Desulfobacterales bacterium]|nr:xylose isomerase [Desulfobacterales bacterium]